MKSTPTGGVQLQEGEEEMTTTKTKTTKQKRKRAPKFPGGTRDINSTLPLAMYDWIAAQSILRHCKKADILREALTLYMNQYEGRMVAASPAVVVESHEGVSDEPEPTEPSTRKIRKF